MEFALKDIAILLTCIFAGCFAVSFGYGLATGLRHRVSEMSLSRSGMQIHTNDVQVWSKIVDRIERIDSSTCKSIRKATSGLTILPTEQHGMSPEVMLVNRDAIAPLIYAAYENHHTRELADGGNLYITDKAHDIFVAIQVWQKHVPELTADLAETFARQWVKKVLIPNLRKACTEKVVFYRKESERSDISKTIKNILVRCRDKNLYYITCIENLAANSELRDLSTIFYQST